MLRTERTGIDWEEAIVEVHGFDQWKHFFFQENGHITFRVTKAFWRQSLERPLFDTYDPVRYVYFNVDR